MKAKFLIPEINYEKFTKDFSHIMKVYKLQLKDFEQISAEENSTSLISQYKLGKKFPTINRFLAICRFFMESPDYLLSPKPKWIECEIDDISKFNVLGKFNDVYYITPSYKYSFEYKKIISILSEEPAPEIYSDFHLHGTRYEDFENHYKGKIIYRFPCINDEQTHKLIKKTLDEYKLSYDQLQILFEYNQKESFRRREKQTQGWTIENLYKLSWIFSKPIEELIVLNFHEETHESLFDPVLFLEYYLEENDEDEDYYEVPEDEDS